MGLFALIGLGLGTAAAWAQNTNQIIAVDPDSAPQGTTALVVTFTLDVDSPPAPPPGVMPDSVSIGSLSGTSVSHASQYVVTAAFDIPADEPAGPRDVAIAFTTPHGALIFSMPGGFTITAGAETPPGIVHHPFSQTAPPGGAAIFTVIAYGTEPLTYQWQKDGQDIAGADGASHTINPVTWDDAGSYHCVVTNEFGTAVSDDALLTVAELPAGAYSIVHTGQDACYDDAGPIGCPAAGQPFHGQDAQHAANPPSYALSADGLCVLDNRTGLVWQRSPDSDRDGDIDAADKFTWNEAQLYPDTLNAESFGGYDDWRLPTIKELYSLIDFRGMDPTMCETEGDCPGLRPFIDTDYFDFAYGDTVAGERVIDSQYASCTQYVSDVDGALLFGVNFADGRIKGYWWNNIPAKTFLVMCVRGNANYGANSFIDNGDGTITDLATGLMWQQTDSGYGMLWEDALAYAESLSHAGYEDWRLPSAKELQSILDYARSPDTSASAAIDPLFSVTPITNEEGQPDYPYYWSATTHVQYPDHGPMAAYVAFGRGLGYMNGEWRDVHGAGCQRSDPKIGDPADYPYGHGPQGDAVRIYNFVRCVRDVTGGELYAGYNLFAPLGETTTYLMDNDGNFVHAWTSAYPPGASVYLLDNGHLLRTGSVGNPVFPSGGGGVIQEFGWCSEILWQFEYSSDQHVLHHDVAPMPNGNLLAIVWEHKSEGEALAAGRDPALLTPDGLYPDAVIEVQPTGPDTGEIVWEWHVWDHLIQDCDPAQLNYGVVADHPELVDLNCAIDDRADWNHTNAIDYNPELDQIVLSVHAFSEIWVIDHSTTTAEAAGHAGGNVGRGGDLIYRWGNPRAYRRGTAADQKLFSQHDAEWIDPGLPGAGNILIFNNGPGRPGGDYSTVDEIAPRLNPDGTYTLEPGGAYGPAGAVWSYQSDPPTDFYASFVSSAQRLPNGNTLICDGPGAYFFEITDAGELVWDYSYTGGGSGTTIFRVNRYAYNHPAFSGANYGLGDLNGDCVLDAVDFLLFADCMYGPEVGVPVACSPADFNGDGDADLQDLTGFQAAFAGP